VLQHAFLQIALGVDDPPHDAFRQLHVLREQREEVLRGNRQADGRLQRAHAAAHRVAFQNLLERQRRGRVEHLLSVVADRHDPAIQDELQRTRGCAAFVDLATGLVTHLLAELDNAEKLVHRREVEQRQAAQAIDEHHRWQRLLP
jgi:hypothetical protein